MAAKPSSSSSSTGGHHTVDIRAAQAQPEDARQSAMSGPINIRGERRPPPMQRAFSRQVSLGSGVTVLGMDKVGKNGGRGSSVRSAQRQEPRVLNHTGALGQAAAGDGAARRGDFSMFRTKSTLSKQNSLLPSRIREPDLELPPHVEGPSVGRQGGEDPLNKSVPAGRYFAALRGPELDEVRVSRNSSSHTW